MSLAEQYPVPTDGAFAEVDPRIRERFSAYHRENPHVLSMFLRYALEMLTAGRRHYGARSNNC